MSAGGDASMIVKVSCVVVIVAAAAAVEVKMTVVAFRELIGRFYVGIEAMGGLIMLI